MTEGWTEDPEIKKKLGIEMNKNFFFKMIALKTAIHKMCGTTMQVK